MKADPKTVFSLRKIHATIAAATVIIAPIASSANAQEVPVSLRDSLPIGSDGLCEAEILAPQSGDGLFDRRYTVICQDAAAPVGEMLVLGDASHSDMIAHQRSLASDCSQTEHSAAIEGLPSNQRLSCTDADGLQQLLLLGQTGGYTYAATGFAIYEDALNLGLASLATDQLVPGKVEIPLTLAADARAFARAQAEAISAEAALAQAYRRANAGSYAEAAEFFEASALALEGGNAVEARLNLALQQSNLGNYLKAALLFLELQDQVGESPILTRLARNFEALDALNRNSPAEALLLLNTPLPEAAADLAALEQDQISGPLADRLAAEQGNAISGATGKLTMLERAKLLDAQAEYIGAIALVSQGNTNGAEERFMRSQEQLLSVRDGRIVSVLWLRGQILAELAKRAESQGDIDGAQALYGENISLIETNYPASPALVSAQAEMAGYYARTDREEEALALFRELVTASDSKPAGALRRLLAPYFELLADQSDKTRAAEEMLAASQLLQRPGLAQTQAVLARELSGGSDEASQLFRQALNINRAIERLRAEIGQASLDSEINEAAQQEEEALANNDPQALDTEVLDVSGLDELAAMKQELLVMQRRQLTLQQSLAQYSRYRVVSGNRMDIAQLSEALNPGEAYYKLITLDEAAYGIFIEKDGATAFRLDATPEEIGKMVDTLRDSIAIDQGGQTITYPFEIATARELYNVMFAKVGGSLSDVSHLVFEPDGDLLRLPLNLLVMDDSSVDRYAARSQEEGGDPYDYRGTNWLGKSIQVSTSVSPTAFRDVRQTRRSDAQNAYLGLGNNLPLGNAGLPMSNAVRSGGMMDTRCEWSPSIWNRPIEADELETAEGIIEDSGQNGQVIIGADFTDDRLRSKEDLDEFRILHFATHGLVTSPEPECPPRPALLTSFGEDDSDGLLSFSEIFDLHLDADLIILSACNTASAGGLAATREAGVSGTGDFALDGLVRAFVGAGGRTVLASHWPVPDEFDATKRLISGLFQAEAGVATADALRQAQLGLMDDAATSHPFYWSAFAVVGDGSIPVRR